MNDILIIRRIFYARMLIIYLTLHDIFELVFREYTHASTDDKLRFYLCMRGETRVNHKFTFLSFLLTQRLPLHPACLNTENVFLS